MVSIRERTPDAENAENAPYGGSGKTGCAVNVGRTERWLNLAAGAGLVAAGLKRRSLGGLALALGGGYLLYRGNTGHCAMYEAIGVEPHVEPMLEVRQQMTVAAGRDEVYRLFQVFQSQPDFMQHLAEVTPGELNRLHWSVHLPAGAKLEFDVEVVEEQKDERVVWQSLPGSIVEARGEIRFVDAPGDRGTEVHSRIDYRPPWGLLGRTAGELLRPALSQLLREDMRRFKQMVEAGETPTIEGQPTGPLPPWMRASRCDGKEEQSKGRPSGAVRPADEAIATDAVIKASMESFPASDPPSWTTTTSGRDPT